MPQLEHILRHTRPGAHPFDPLPPRLLLNLFDLLGKVIQSLLRSSLINGNVPVCFKHAVVQPLLKKRLGYVRNVSVPSIRERGGSLREGMETLCCDDIGDLLGSPDHL